MSTIPVIFNERQLKRTVLGGTVDSIERIPLSVILLNRSGSTFLSKNLEELERIGFRKIVCVENVAISYTLEEISKRFPKVKIVIPHEEVTPGDMINLGMSEVPDGEVLVIWDTISVSPKFLVKNIVARLDADETFCRVPLLTGRKLDLLPTHMIPHVNKGVLTVDAVLAAPDGCPTFYPFDYVGIYNRRKFILTGGYDHTIKSPFWQNLDLAMRAWLWGEQITTASQIRLGYEADVPVEDSTPDEYQLRFYLKNLAPKYFRDYAYIPKSKFISYFIRSGSSLAEALENFKEARSWVSRNKFRFKKDASCLIENWESQYS